MTVIGLGLALLGVLFPAGGEDELPLSLADDALEAVIDEADVALVESLFPSPPPSDLLLQARRASAPKPFFDFGNAELGGFLGMAQYSGDFEADPGFEGGAIFRVPLPKLGGTGIWIEGLFGKIERDIDPILYLNRDGNYLAGAVGVDYTLLDNERFLIRPQAGVMYVKYDDIDGLEDGMGVLLGSVFGVHWIKLKQTVTISYNPQWVSDGGDWILFHSLGVSVTF
jgi:hypothetical protein